MIPYSFDPTNVNSVPQSTELVNGVLDHDKLTDHHYFAWQSFLRRFALEPELISDAWFHDKLWKSLDDELKAEIRSDFDDLPHECKGSISLLRLIINRMVKNNQESRRAMEEFIKTFDIQKFPGEDVTKATLRLKAIAQSLGTNRLPSDIVHRVLEGFARASTPAFSNLCHHQKSMISSSLVKANLRQDTLYKTLISVLTDLDIEYNELLSGHRWLGISQHALPSSSVFVANSWVNEDDTDDEYNNYVVFTARTGRPSLPFHLWVKDKLCRHCHEMGHIQRDCPKLHPAGRPSSRHTATTLPCGSRDINTRNQGPPRRRDSNAKPTTLASTHEQYSNKIKALILAAHDLATSSVHVTTPALVDNVQQDDSAPTEINHDSTFDYSGYLAALGCPKE